MKGHALTSARKAFLAAAAVALALSALPLAAGAQEDLRGGPALTAHQARKALEGLQEERAGAFASIAVGSLVGFAIVMLIHAIWRRKPTAARILAPALLAVASARILGLLMMYGDVTTSATATGIVWAFLAASIAFSFRAPPVTTHRIRMPWLAVPTHAKQESKRKDKPAERAGRPGNDEADRMFEEAIAKIDEHEVDEAVSLLEASIASRDTKRARVCLATIHGARGDSARALDELDKALALDPQYTEALAEKAYALKTLGRDAEATEVKTLLREAKLAHRSLGKRAKTITECPACQRQLQPDQKTCECGLELKTCSSCGREGVSLHPREGTLVCNQCRTQRAATHVKKPALLTEARKSGGAPPWMAAAAFAASVIVGAGAAPLYSWWSGVSGARELGELARDVMEEAAMPVDNSGEAVLDLQRRRVSLFWRNDFLKDHPASLKLALAIHAIGRSRELAAMEPALARFAAGWGKRRAAEAVAALESFQSERLPSGIWHSFTQIRGDFEREITIRRARASAITRHTTILAAPPVKKDWRSIWKKPAVGVVFYIDVFRRVSIAARSGPEPIGTHEDGSALAAWGVLRAEVVEPVSGNEAAHFALRIVSLPHKVDMGGSHPLAIRPDVKLEPVADKPVAGPYLIEYGASCEFLAAYDETKQPSELLATDKTIYAGREIPHKSLPLYSPGVDKSWEQDETLLWPYGRTSTTRGPSVKQIARWHRDETDRARVAVGWLLRYQPAAKKYTERIVQSWSSGRPFWDFYDDEVLFFRTWFESYDR